MEIVYFTDRRGDHRDIVWDSIVKCCIIVNCTDSIQNYILISNVLQTLKIGPVANHRDIVWNSIVKYFIIVNSTDKTGAAYKIECSE